MNTIAFRQEQKVAVKNKLVEQSKFSIVDKYNTYVEAQEALKVYHYLVVIIAIPCVYMTISIIAMAQMVDWFVYFIAFSMILFFANVIAHIGEASSKVFIPLFHITTILFIVIPAITYFITQM